MGVLSWVARIRLRVTGGLSDVSQAVGATARVCLASVWHDRGLEMNSSYACPAPPSERIASDRDEPPSGCAADCVGAVGGAKLSGDRRHVKLDGLGADAKPRCDGLVREPLGEPLEDLDLSRREWLFESP